MDTVSVVQKHVIVDKIALRELRVGIYESIWPKRTQAHTMVTLRTVVSFVMDTKNVDNEWSSLSCRKAIYTDKTKITIRRKRYKILAFWAFAFLLSVPKIWFCKGVDRVRFNISKDRPKKLAFSMFIIPQKTSDVVTDIKRRNWNIGKRHFRPLHKFPLSFSFSWKFKKEYVKYQNDKNW